MALKNVIGQDRALRVLLGTLVRDRVPSALLVSGEAGIGKRAAALSYAKAVNCFTPDQGDSCDTCGSCRKIQSGAHPDVTVLTPEGDEIKIDAIRRVIEALTLSPFEGKKKVVIIEDAERMNRSAANAFLKTLEEPPDHSLIVLLSSNPDGLPSTIRSRCAVVRFNPLPAGVMEGPADDKLTDGDRAFVSRLVAGRPGLSVTRDFAEERQRFAEHLDSMLRGEPGQVWQDRAEMKSWIEMALVYLRDLAVRVVTGRKDLLFFSDAGGQDDLGRILQAFQRLESLKALMELNLNRQVSWSYTSVTMRETLGTEGGHGR